MKTHLDFDALHVGLVLEDQLLQKEERALVRHTLSHLRNGNKKNPITCELYEQVNSNGYSNS